MSLIEWNESFSVGSPAMDADHRRLLQILNDIYDEWQSGATSLTLGNHFASLIKYADRHFAREEAMLRASDYDRWVDQRDQHEHLRGQIMAFVRRHLRGEKPETLSRDAAKFLRDWLINHILEEDMQYSGTIGGSRPAMRQAAE